MTAGSTQAVPTSLVPQGKHEQLVKAAHRWVSLSLYGPLFKQMRQSAFKSELFSGGRGGAVFSSLLDQQLADRMAQRVNRGVAQSVVRSIERAAPGGQAGEDGRRVDSVLRSGSAVQMGQEAGAYRYVAATR